MTNGHTLRLAKDVRNDQGLDDRQSPMRDCPNCGAKNDKTHSKDTCPVRNRECFNCGIQGHYGRMCREPRKPKTVLTQDGCPWCGAKVHSRGGCPAQGKKCFNCSTEGHYVRMCKIKKETPTESGTQPGNEELNWLAVLFCDLASGERGFEALGSGVANSRDTLSSCPPRREGQEALSTNIWPSLENRIWRPGLVSADVMSADGHFKTHHGSTELNEKWDTDSSGVILGDIRQTEADFFPLLSCPYCVDTQE